MFSNVPVGVNYTVTPTQEEGYTQTVSHGPGAISADSSASADIINRMDSSLNAGIVYRSTGNVLVIVIAMIGLLLLLRKTRRKGKKK